MLPVESEAADCIHITDDEDEEDGSDQSKPPKKIHLEIIHIASKGWKTCSTGFHDTENNGTDGYSSRVTKKNISVSKNILLGCTKQIELQNKPQKHMTSLARRRRSAPHRLCSSKPLFGFTKENISAKNNKETFISESDIEISSSPEDKNEKFAKTQKHDLQNSRKWAFDDLSNSFNELGKCETDATGLTASKKENAGIRRSVSISRSSLIKANSKKGNTCFLSVQNSGGSNASLKRACSFYSPSLHNAKTVQCSGSAVFTGQLKPAPSGRKCESNQKSTLDCQESSAVSENSYNSSLLAEKSRKRSQNGYSVPQSKLLFDRWIKALGENASSDTADSAHGTHASKTSWPLEFEPLSHFRKTFVSNAANCDKLAPSSSLCNTIPALHPETGTGSPRIGICNSPATARVMYSPVFISVPSDAGEGSTSSALASVSLRAKCSDSTRTTPVLQHNFKASVKSLSPDISTPSTSSTSSVAQSKSTSPLISEQSSESEKKSLSKNVVSSSESSSDRKKSLNQDKSVPATEVEKLSVGCNANGRCLESGAPEFEKYQFGSVNKMSDADIEIEECVGTQSGSGTQNSVQISSVESRESSSGQAGTALQGQKGSDWLQTINWRKSSAKKENLESIEKKELKYQSLVPGGLAERAWKLESKEKTARVIWSYKKTQKLKMSVHKSLAVKLQTFSVAEGFVLSKCSVLKRPTSTRAGSASSSANSSKSMTKSPNASDEKACEDQCYLLLKFYMVKDMQLRPGNVLHIFPPWQTLQVPSLSHQVILGAYFVQVADENTQNDTCGESCKMTEEIIFSGGGGGGQFVPQQAGDMNQCEATGINNNRQIKGISGNAGPGHKNLSTEHKSLPEAETRGGFVAHNTDLMCHTLERKYQDDICSSYSLASAFSENGKEFPVCARVQRIWCHVATPPHKLVKPGVSNPASEESSVYLRYSLLLQDCNRQFCELHIPDYKPELHNVWKDLLKSGEGKCFKFEGVRVLNSLTRTKYPLLFSYLRGLSVDGKKCQQSSTRLICYKATTSCEDNEVSSISDESCPPFIPYESSPLDRIVAQHDSRLRRFTCTAKVMCMFSETFYILDKSLKENPHSSYIKMKFCPLSYKPSSLSSGSVISVIDAVVQKGSLFIDRYSRVSLLSPLVGSAWISSDLLASYLNVSSEEVIALTFLDSVKCQWKPVKLSSKALDLVAVKGRVADVDKETAVSWLECSCCSSEDLYQDSELKIYCAHCKSVVAQPKMNMKTNVYVTAPGCEDASVNVELLCSTTKKILNVLDSDIQPQCDVSDVLGKPIGPIICCVKNKKVQEGLVKFDLTEVTVR